MYSDYQRVVRGRIRTMGAVVLVLAFVLIWRLFDIMVVRHDHYLALAQDQQRFERIELAQRGKILVHDSKVEGDKYYPLAFDAKKFAVWVVPKNVSDKNKTAQNLSGLIGMSAEEIYNQINNDKIYIPPIKRGLSLDEGSKVKAAKISGVLVVPEYNRTYPEGALASHILGFVNAEGEGKYGFEGRYNSDLKGVAGEVKGEKDTLGRIINLLDRRSPQNGTDFVLTIDRSVQYFVEKRLAEGLTKYQADSASAVVIDVKTGGVLAMAGVPNFDPNDYKEQAKKNAGNFVNPVIAHLYEPGSVFKPLIMASALDAGVVTLDTKQVFNNYTVVDGFEIHTAEDKAFGEETMGDVITNSDNVGMVWVADQLGKEKMYDYLKKFNLFEKTGVDLDTEAVGYCPALKQWRNINRATISFGQGVSVTPMEMVAAYAAIANGGVYIQPSIVDKIVFPDGSEKKVEKKQGDRIIKEEASKQITDMLVNAVDNGHGWRANVPGFRIAGKTGTAQIPAASGGYEKSDDGLGVYNHSFAGYGPAENPRFAMLVKFERPRSAKYAENTSAEVFGQIASFLLNYYYRETPTRPLSESRLYQSTHQQ